MAGLHDDHESFKHWYTEIKTILEKIFSSQSIHHQNFLALRFKEISVKTFASPEIDKINSARYKRDLENVKNILQAAIKELTLDRTLLKKIPTTPKTVEVSLQGTYFISSGILNAEMTKAIESALDGSGLTPLYGAEAFQKEEPFRHQIDQIRETKLGIYDLSVRKKPEVYIELGIALGLEKKVLIIYKKNSSLPNIIKHLNKIEYKNSYDLTEKIRT